MKFLHLPVNSLAVDATGCDNRIDPPQWVEILHRGPSQVKNRYYKKRLFVTIMNPNFMGNINLDIFVHSDICRLKNGYFKNIRIVENDKKNFAMIHISSQGMFK